MPFPDPGRPRTKTTLGLDILMLMMLAEAANCLQLFHFVAVVVVVGSKNRRPAKHNIHQNRGEKFRHRKKHLRMRHVNHNVIKNAIHYKMTLTDATKLANIGRCCDFMTEFQFFCFVYFYFWGSCQNLEKIRENAGVNNKKRQNQNKVGKWKKWKRWKKLQTFQKAEKLEKLKQSKNSKKKIRPKIQNVYTSRESKKVGKIGLSPQF